tara:strand:+ start:7692 stop:8834 length:1143 start_codon:yes stop_codon:yes gene_type:complete
MNLIKNLKRFNFSEPKKADIIIFDEIDIDSIFDLFPKNKKIYILKTRPSEFLLNFNFNLKFIKNIFIHKKFLFKLKNNNFLIKIISFLRDIRILTVIKIVKPKLVFSLIDNHPRVGRIIKIYNLNLNYISIQNGLRNSWERTPICSHDIYFTYSDRQLKILKNMGWEFNKVYVNGSFRAAKIFQSKKLNFNISRDILIISAWRGNISIDNDYIEQIEAMKLMNIMIADYVKRKNIKVGILTRSNRNTKDWFVPYYNLNEEEFYKKIYEGNADIIENKKLGKSCYEESAKSKICISSLSSLVYELYLYGINSFYFNLHKTDKYHKDLPIDIRYKINSQEELDYVLDNEISKSFNNSNVKINSNNIAIDNIKLIKKIINDNS